MKNISEKEAKLIVRGIVKEIRDNRTNNETKRKVAKNGNLIKGVFAMKVGIYPSLQEQYEMTKEESYKAVEKLASDSKEFKIGKSRYGAIFYLPEDYKEYEGKQKAEKKSFFEKYVK